MTIVVYPYKMGSASGKLLANALGAKRVFPNKDYRPKAGDVVVNWGNGYRPDWASEIPTSRVLNPWNKVCNAIDKLVSFELFKRGDVSFPDLTYKADVAMGWLKKNHIVIGRETSEGTRGQGCHVIKAPRDFKDCRFYTKYVSPTKEFRLYVFGDSYLDGLEKRRLIEAMEKGTVDPFIRTEEAGWTFCRQHVSVPEDCKTQAIKAVKSLGLLYGGVDVIWNQSEQKAYVLEVNTAPGIFGETVTKYSQSIQNHIRAHVS